MDKIRIAGPEETRGREQFIKHFERAKVEADDMLSNPCEFLIVSRSMVPNTPDFRMTALVSNDTTMEMILCLVGGVGVDLVGVENLDKAAPDQRHLISLMEGLRYVNEYVTERYRAGAAQH